MHGQTGSNGTSGKGKDSSQVRMEVQMGSQVNATVRALVTMEDWVRVGLVKVVPDWAPPMRKEVDHVLRPGSEVKPEI